MAGVVSFDHFTVLLGEKSLNEMEFNASNAVLGVWKAVLSPVVHSDMSGVRTDHSWIQSLILPTQQDVQCGYSI